ncbi:MAG TPA: serine/threonine-protein kinase [Solirubrobacteraceae bacterium]
MDDRRTLDDRAQTDDRGHTPVRIADHRARPRRRRSATEDGGPIVLNRYRLHRRLGAGGFGTVWHARDERLERDVAVKLLPRDRIVGGRFEREARAAARLAHPGIVTLYEAAVDDEGAYLVSELVRGATLGQLLEAGRLSDRDIVEIGIALCAALAHAHGERVVHRDVKPSNILIPERPVTPAQLAKLTDFGVARIIGGDSLTRTGDVVGTAGYMAPEQAEGLEAGAPADLYSLALVIYEALTGINPVGTGAAASRARRLGAYLPPLRRQRRDLPRELGCAIDLALRPRPRERGSIDELRYGLAASVGVVGDHPGVVSSPWPAQVTSNPRRSKARAPKWDQPPAAEQHPLTPQPAPREDQPPLADRRAPIPWPQRALAGAAAAIVAAWLIGVVLSHPPVPPAVAAAIGAVAVAALPRIGWVALLIAAGVGLAADGHAGATLVFAIAALLPVLLMPLHPARWPLGAFAPALGAIGLAGAWPAIAGRAPGPWQRAALGATGWIMLVVANVLGTSALYMNLGHTIAARPVWEPSLSETFSHVISPVATAGVLAPAVVWALAAVLLPWTTFMRPLAVQLVLVTVWTAATASATTIFLHAGHARTLLTPGAAVLGAIAAGVVALAPSVAEAFRASRTAGNTPIGLA